MCVCGISKPNQTKLNQSKPKTICFVCLFKPSIETKPNQTFSKINSILSAWNKIKSKVLEKLARAAQLLYRPVLFLASMALNCLSGSWMVQLGVRCCIWKWRTPKLAFRLGFATMRLLFLTLDLQMSKVNDLAKLLICL